MKQKFKIDITRIEKSGEILSNCGDILFVNLSTTDTVTINGFPIPPLSAQGYGANQDELNVTGFSILYNGADKLLYVHKKIYLQQ